jgi:hypothetical protein
MKRFIKYFSITFFCIFLCTIIGCVYVFQHSAAQLVSCRFEKKVGFDDALLKAIKVATDMGLVIIRYEKESGVFFSQKVVAGGLGETTQLGFSLLKEENDKLSFTIKVQSSHTEGVINDFLKKYGKYFKIKCAEPLVIFSDLQ